MYKPYLEEDYEAHFKNGTRPNPFAEEIIPVGRLYDMCHIIERNHREQTNRLSKYECKPNSRQYDKNLAIKEFTRSCVGADQVNSDELRPWSVLRHTLRHLLLNICLKDDDWMYICDFVFDRLKAVRQDLVIQRIEGLRYIELLEGSVRFLVYSMYRLTCTLKDYPSSLRKPQQIISNEGLVKGLDNYEMNVVREMKLTMQCLRDCLNSLIVQYQENVPNSPNRALFEGVNLLVNLPFLHGHTFTATNFLINKKLRNGDPAFKIVFKMFKDHLVGNHLSALKQLPKLADYPLLVLAYAPTIAQLQIDLIDLLRKLYSSPGTNKATLSYLASIICPDYLEPDKDERLLFAQLMAVQFGIYDEETGDCEFDKNFNLPEDYFARARLKFAKQKARMNPGPDNETRIYALQMIAGKDWHFYQKVIEKHGLESILDPAQPPIMNSNNEI